jgi:3-deoxy-D-arabino-heptulosonate 7-phosphate (DAHP) synthase
LKKKKETGLLMGTEVANAHVKLALNMIDVLWIGARTVNPFAVQEIDALAGTDKIVLVKIQ